ncbi:hypothetical protein C4D60_Mb01t09110 [Musa balbisiana]|uniref:Uncharacterized protein n=1 Tax=Musa balbisiana TaxID=52838 RepID=A0A4V4H777_MUSBA|nr:hypothetical protein C4D60_Mb01t09110 [Musa balbisiana]
MDDLLLWKEHNHKVLVAGIVMWGVTLIEIAAVAVAVVGDLVVVVVVVDEVQTVVTALNVAILVTLLGNALLVMVHEGIGMAVGRTDMGVVVAVIADMDLTGMGIVSLIGTEMGEAVGVLEVIVIIVNALVHMNALVEVAVAIDLDPVAAAVTGLLFPSLLQGLGTTHSDVMLL